MLENIQQQQVQLLAKKALLLEETKQVDAQLSQLAAVAQFAQSLNPVEAPEAAAPVAAE